MESFLKFVSIQGLREKWRNIAKYLRVTGHRTIKSKAVVTSTCSVFAAAAGNGEIFEGHEHNFLIAAPVQFLAEAHKCRINDLKLRLLAGKKEAARERDHYALLCVRRLVKVVHSDIISTSAETKATSISTIEL